MRELPSEDDMGQMADAIVQDSMFLNNCDRGGRRYCCSYHSGMEDALDLFIGRLTGEE